MKKIINTVILTLLISGCANFDFVYNKDFLKSPLINSTELIIEGDDKEDALIYLKEAIGDTRNNVYNLKINITKSNNTKKVDIDSTASKIEIMHEIIYMLIKNGTDCKIYTGKIITTSNYNSKSAGYNFGTDTSIKVIINKNIKSNINKFFVKLRNTNPNLDCFNAD